MKVIIASDHAGFELKEKIINQFKVDFEWVDNGTFSSESVDYPDFAHPLADKVSKGEFEYGILICGTGNGIGMTANKHANVRAALCWKKEIAELARQHNNANILVLPARFISDEDAFAVVKTFFSTAFEGGRHQRRVEKINIR
ncbi:MAG: ribose 5-phosphate isomerase B [Bacteroidales bacterium]|nr:ribose 5-phosphate isomerase B [Bacteroidales bacterium]